MNSYRAVEIAEGFGEPAANEAEVLEAWQHLIDSGMAFKLQGSYGRQATRLIEAGYCTAPKAVA